MSTIRVKNLRKSYGDFEALKGISFEVNQGEVVGFLGPNGAGKTTTMKILTCFMAANKGAVHVAGHDCSTHPDVVRKKIGYLPESNPLYTDMTVFEYLQFMGELHDMSGDMLFERIKRVLTDCSLLDRINNPIHTLSKGYKQRVGLAAALIHDPEILILDEPSVGLDPNQIIEIRHLIKKLGEEKTVILCSHRLSEVELTCNRLIIIDQGRIVASGTASELRNTVGDHCSLKVKVRGDREKSLEVLKSVRGVRQVHSHSVLERGTHGFELMTAKNRDPRADIARLVVEHDLKLLEIRRETVSLEEIFNQVTRHD